MECRIVRNYRSTALRTKLYRDQMQDFSYQIDARHLSAPVSTETAAAHSHIRGLGWSGLCDGGLGYNAGAEVCFDDTFRRRFASLFLGFFLATLWLALFLVRGLRDIVRSVSGSSQLGLDGLSTGLPLRCANDTYKPLSRIFDGLRAVLRNTVGISYGVPYPHNFVSARSFA